MFELIEPKDRRFHHTLVNSFLERIKLNQVLSHSFKDHKNSTFIITKDETLRICGGALLVKQSPVSLYKKIDKKVNSVPSLRGETWNCTVYLHMEENALASDFEVFFKSFYHQLYEKLVEFGTKKGIVHLCMVLEPGEYLCTEAIGLWPYVLEVRPQESLDGLFHGVLSLTKHHLSAHQSGWGKMAPQNKKLAA